MLFRQYFYVYKNREKIIGFVAGSVKSDVRSHLSAIYVKEEFRKKGVGKNLLKTLETAFEKSNFSKITLEVKEDNKEAIEFYKGLGYAFAGKKPRYYGEKDALVYSKEFHESKIRDQNHL
jgi:ribosomal protein S18 acetylase RimI-like enzyme